jgi:hypothetical protein
MQHLVAIAGNLRCDHPGPGSIADNTPVMCTTAYLPTKPPPTRSKTRGKNAVRIATGAAGYGTVLWLPTMGSREQRPSGYMEGAVQTRRLTS